jgi:16S rRNA (cytosine967-C5)-methyltransferase
VLREILRNRHRLPLPVRPADGSNPAAAVDYLGITHSHPDWLVARWLDRYGLANAERWVQFNNDTPPLTIRANRLRLTREELAAALVQDEIETEPTRYAPDGLTVRSGNPLTLPSTGSFVVQDEASQLVPLAVDVKPGMRVLDLCASPGGKTTEMAAALGDQGLIVASDVRPRRLRTLVDTVRASGADRVRVMQVPAEGSLPFRPIFDRVLVDAPCSGLGTLRRDPDIRWRRSASEVVEMGTRQVELLRRAAAVLAPGGRLVYATCSSEPEENEAVVQRVLEREPHLTLIDLRGTSPVLDGLIDVRGMMRTLPFAHGLEAFFAAAMTRR